MRYTIRREPALPVPTRTQSVLNIVLLATVGTASLMLSPPSAASDSLGELSVSGLLASDEGPPRLEPLPRRDPGACPARMSPIIPQPDAYDFPVAPGLQQALLQRMDFDIGRRTADGVFKERTLLSINEVRNLYFGPASPRALSFQQTFTADEYHQISGFADRMKRVAREHRISMERAVAVGFAAHATRTDFNALLARTDNGASGYTGSASDWLYMIKTYGGRVGLTPLAQHIRTDRQDGVLRLRVDDPAVFMMVDQLREQPRLALLFQALQLRLGAHMPQTAFLPGKVPEGDINAIRRNLHTLGIDNLSGLDEGFGPRTEAALNLYRNLYAPLASDGRNIDDYLPHFAKLAELDARSHGIPLAAASSIRLASLKTGADFNYMMRLAYVESTFDVTAGVSTSTAKGLYQFIEDTTRREIATHGRNHGLGSIAPYFSVTVDMNGMQVGRASNPFLNFAALRLRDQPHIAAGLSAELQLNNEFLLECHLGRKLSNAELYMGHFMGHDAAGAFLSTMRENPDAVAAAAFPDAAAANPWVFYTKNGEGSARSFADVLNGFAHKFNNHPYTDRPQNIRAAFNSALPAEHPARMAQAPAAGSPQAARGVINVAMADNGRAVVLNLTDPPATRGRGPARPFGS